MRLKPFFSYYGSKARLAPRYPGPQHRLIIEPFAGSAQYATLYHDREVLLIDADPVIVAIWRYLIGASPKELLALPDPPPGANLSELPVCQEARWLIGLWCGRANAYPARFARSWYEQHRNDSHARSWGAAARRRLAHQVEHIRHWRIEQLDWSDVPDTEATWFIDPPYQSTGHKYRCSNAQIDYEALGPWCRNRPGQVIVCEAGGASWLPFRHLTTARTTSGRYSPEVVWTKGSPVQLELLGGAA